MKYSQLLTLLFFFSATAMAGLPDYNAPVIEARANINEGYNLPPMSFLNDTSPVINNRGDIAFKILGANGDNSHALWVKSAEESAGKIIYTAPEERFLTEPTTISEKGKIAFNLYDEGVTDGLFLIDINTEKVDQVLAPDNLSIQFYTYPQVLVNNHIFFRATNDDNERLFYEFNGKGLNKILAEGVEGLGIKSSYLFRPTVNEAGSIAFKSRMGQKGEWDESAPDSIILLTPTPENKTSAYKVSVIAQDKDGDAHSAYLGFGNTVSLSKSGLIAFIATQLDGKKAIVLSRENILKTFAVEGTNDISEIELFAPKVNDQGLIVFRARDTDGKRGIYIADESGVKKLIGEDDELPTDVGMGKILYNPNFPSIGGNVDMNDSGDIVFNCLIVSSTENKELGSAVFKMSAKK